MALLFADGFDIYDNKPDVFNTGWVNVEGTTHVFSTTAGRYGGGAIGGTGTFPGWGLPVSFTNGDTFSLSWAFWHDGAGTSTEYLMYNRASGGSVPFQLKFDATTGVISVVDAVNTTVATTSAALTGSVWHWIELTITVGTTGSVTLKVDGSSLFSGTVNTYTGAAYATLGLYGSSSSWYADDVILTNPSGSYMTAPPGNCKIETLRPTADGGVVDWTANTGADYAAVDDPNGSSDGDTTYIDSSTVGQESRFALSDLGTASTAIFAVQPRVKVRNDDGGARTMRTLINRSGSEATGTAFTPSTSYGWSRGDIFYVDPASSTSFTDSNVNALQSGVEIVS